MGLNKIVHAFFSDSHFKTTGFCFIMFHPNGCPVLLSYVSNYFYSNPDYKYVGEVVAGKYCYTKSLEDPEIQIKNGQLMWTIINNL